MRGAMLHPVEGVKAPLVRVLNADVTVVTVCTSNSGSDAAVLALIITSNIKRRALDADVSLAADDSNVVV